MLCLASRLALALLVLSACSTGRLDIQRGSTSTSMLVSPVMSYFPREDCSDDMRKSFRENTYVPYLMAFGVDPESVFLCERQAIEFGMANRIHLMVVHADRTKYELPRASSVQRLLHAVPSRHKFLLQMVTVEEELLPAWVGRDKISLKLFKFSPLLSERVYLVRAPIVLARMSPGVNASQIPLWIFVGVYGKGLDEVVAKTIIRNYFEYSFEYDIFTFGNPV